MVPAGNKAKCLSSVNHTTKTIHHHHHHHHTSLLSNVFNINESVDELNMDLEKVDKWAFQWKNQFNLDFPKQEKEVIFSRKLKNCFYFSLTFDNNKISKCSRQKHLGVVLDPKLDFSIYVE